MTQRPSSTQPTLPPEGVHIGVLARRLDLTPRTLRFWEQQGLVPAAERTAGGFRAYGAVHERAAAGVQGLKRAGLSLEQIRQMQLRLGAGPDALAGTSAVAAALARRAEAVSEHIRQQQRLLEELEVAGRALAGCHGCHGKLFDPGCVHCLETSCDPTPPASLSCLLRARQENGS